MAYEFDQLIKDVKEMKVIRGQKEYSGDEYMKVLKSEIDKAREKGFFLDDYLEFPRGVQLEYTSACNLKCKYCYNNSGSGDTESLSLSISLLSTLIKELAENKVMKVVISGGEPCMDSKKLQFIMDNLSQHGIRIELVTNGWFIEEEFVKNIKKYKVDKVQVSIDGCKPGIHDKLRGKKGSWERVVRGLKLLNDAGFYTRAAMVITREDSADVKDFMDMCFLLDTTEVIIGRLIMLGRAYRYINEIGVSNEDWEKCCDAAKKWKLEHGKMMKVEIGGEEGLLERANLLMPKHACVIRPNGDVKIDCILPFIGGNIKVRCLKDIWIEKIRNAYTNPKVINYISKMKPGVPLIPLERREEKVFL